MNQNIQFINGKGNVYPHPTYPVGSIYLSVNNTNPSKWFGGTWEQIAKGRTLVGVDTNDTDFNMVKKTGGSKYLQEHNHVWSNKWGNVNSDGGTWAAFSSLNNPYAPNTLNAITDGVSNVPTGGSGNLQPYFTCYIWCRVA